MSKRNQVLYILSAILLVLIIITACIISLLNFQSAKRTGNVKPDAQVTFMDDNHEHGQSDSLKIVANGLSAPPDGYQYNAYLINTVDETVLPLGTLQSNQHSYQLQAIDPQTTNLLSEGDLLEITQNQLHDQQPSAQVVLSATFPLRASVHIRHLLVSFPGTPNHVALLEGLRIQAGALNAQAQRMKDFADQHNQLGIGCSLQSMLNIIEGRRGEQYAPLPSECQQFAIVDGGDGFGLLGKNDGYISVASSHATLASIQSDATDTIRTYARKLQNCTDTIKTWTIDLQTQLEALETNPDDTSSLPMIVSDADKILNGTPRNGAKLAAPLPGEGGALTAYQQGQLMATLTLQQPKH